MKVYTKRSILSIYLEVGVGGKIEKFGLRIKNYQGSEKKYDSYKKKVCINGQHLSTEHFP